MWFGFQRCEARRYFFGSHSVGKVTDIKGVQERVRMKLAKSGTRGRRATERLRRQPGGVKRKHGSEEVFVANRR